MGPALAIAFLVFIVFYLSVFWNWVCDNDHSVIGGVIYGLCLAPWFFDKLGLW